MKYNKQNKKTNLGWSVRRLGRVRKSVQLPRADCARGRAIISDSGLPYRLAPALFRNWRGADAQAGPARPTVRTKSTERTDDRGPGLGLHRSRFVKSRTDTLDDRAARLSAPREVAKSFLVSKSSSVHNRHR